jgi:ribonucleoside-triphosphate reductase
MNSIIEETLVPCEIYSRVVGYMRPVSEWNLGKKEEFKERKNYEYKE